MNVDHLIHQRLKERRDALRAAGVCINSSFNPRPGKEHGPVVKAGRCECCWAVKKISQ